MYRERIERICLEINSNGRRVKTIDDAGEREHIKLIQDEGSIFCRVYILKVGDFVK